LQLAEIKRKNDMMWVALSASMMMKRFMRKKGCSHDNRFARYTGLALNAGGQLIRNTECNRAAVPLLYFLKDTNSLYLMRNSLRDFYNGVFKI